MQPCPLPVPPYAAGWAAPRPGAAAPLFTFGRYTEQQQHEAQAAAPAAGISQRPERANFDPPAEALRWECKPRNAVTVSGAPNADIEAFWRSADAGAVAALVNADARLKNSARPAGLPAAAGGICLPWGHPLPPGFLLAGACCMPFHPANWVPAPLPSSPAPAEAQGLGSTIKANLGDTEQFNLAQAQSLYKQDMAAQHLRVGKRGVELPPEALQAVRRGCN